MKWDFGQPIISHRLTSLSVSFLVELLFLVGLIGLVDFVEVVEVVEAVSFVDLVMVGFADFGTMFSVRFGTRFCLSSFLPRFCFYFTLLLSFAFLGQYLA